MAGASGGSLPEAPRPSNSDADALDRYIAANQDRYTPDALLASLVASGHDPEAAQAALRRMEARRDAGPTIRRARRVIIVAYGLTYLVLAAGLIGYTGPHSEGILATVLLTIFLGLAFAIASWWLRGRRRTTGLAGLLVLPIVLLVAVAGTCMYTTWTPFLFLQQVTNGGPIFQGDPGPAPEATGPGPTPAATQPPP